MQQEMMETTNDDKMAIALLEVGFIPDLVKKLLQHVEYQNKEDHKRGPGLGIGYLDVLDELRRETWDIRKHIPLLDEFYKNSEDKVIAKISNQRGFGWRLNYNSHLYYKDPHSSYPLYIK